MKPDFFSGRHSRSACAGMATERNNVIPALALAEHFHSNLVFEWKWMRLPCVFFREARMLLAGIRNKKMYYPCVHAT